MEPHRAAHRANRRPADRGRAGTGAGAGGALAQSTGAERTVLRAGDGDGGGAGVRTRSAGGRYLERGRGRPLGRRPLADERWPPGPGRSRAYNERVSRVIETTGTVDERG